MTDMTYEEQKNYVTLLVYGTVVISSLLFTTASSFCFYLVAVKASENLHHEMTEAVIKAPVLIFDTNPVGRILNRFSKDIGCMDDLLPGQLLFTVQMLFIVVSATVLTSVSNVWLFIVCTPLTFLFLYLAKYYLKSSREIRRLESLTCSPVYSCIADTVEGLEIIRSSKMEQEFLRRLYRLVLRVHTLIEINENNECYIRILNLLVLYDLSHKLYARDLFASQGRVCFKTTRAYGTLPPKTLTSPSW